MGTHVMVLELTSYSSSFFWTDCVSSELLGWVGVGEALGEVLGESDTLLPSDTGATMACNRQNKKLKKWRTLTFIGHVRWILFNNFFFFLNTGIISLDWEKKSKVGTWSENYIKLYTLKLIWIRCMDHYLSF